MDNATIHSARIVKQMFQEWETSLCFNAPYNPKDNPAELVIAIIKKFVRVQYYEDETELIQGIAKAFRKIKKEHIQNTCKHTFKNISL